MSDREQLNPSDSIGAYHFIRLLAQKYNELTDIKLADLPKELEAFDTLCQEGFEI